MNKTTDELMNLLMSKEDLPQYIEENSNEFLQSSLRQYLNQLQTEHGLKKGTSSQMLLWNAATDIRFSPAERKCLRGMF